MTRALPALLLVAVVGLFMGCFSGPTCSGHYYTESHSHVNDVDFTVEGLGLEAIEWEFYVNLLDSDFVDDELFISLYQVECPEISIFISCPLYEDGTLGAECYQHISYHTAPCPMGWVNERWYSETEGTAIFERAQGEVTIHFNNLHITNSDPPPADPPSLSSITLNGEYRAPISCIMTS